MIDPRPLSPALAAGLALRTEPFVPGTSIGRYRIVALAGSGAMGDVYRAHDPALDRDVALKVLPSDLVHDRDRVRRFAHEARAASALSHPHIVTIYEVGHARPSLNVQPIAGARPPRGLEVHYIAMEYIDGRTLREAVEGDALPLRRCIELLAEVADGLTKAHAAGIIHRDLKPDNILVAREGYAKIVDFGLAKLVDSDAIGPIGADSPTVALTQKGEILGTPAYMSPEQVTGGTIDQRSDIFAFGCILYELLNGRQPFDGDSFVDTLHKIIHDAPPPQDESTPLELRQVVETCLQKNPAGRYASIADAGRALRGWLYAEAVPVLPRARRKPVIGRRWLVAVAIILALVIAVGVALARRYAGGKSRAEELSIRRVTSNGRVMRAAVAPDGRYVAYVIDDAQGSSVWIEQIETRSRLQIAPPSHAMYAGLAFSRDGNYVYFTRYDSEPLGALWRVPILGGKAEMLVQDVDTLPAFSPDGAHLAFVRDDYNRATSTIYVANSDGSGVRSLSSSRIPHRFASPTWAPDGQHLVAVDDTSLAEIDYPSGQRHDLSTKVRFQKFNGVTWMPDGSLVAAAAGEYGSDHIRLWRVDPASGECRALTDELSSVLAPTVTADGSTIAALQVVRQANLFWVDDASGAHQLTTGIGSADGVGGVAWAGDRVLYSSSADGNPDLWSVDPKGGEPVRLTTAGAIDVTPTPAPDGSLVVYRSGSGMQFSLWSMRPDGSERRALTSGEIDGDFAISPDSKALAWASLDRPSNEWVLWTMPLAGGERHRLTSRRSVLDQIRFAPDGKSILFTGYENTHCVAFRIPAAGGVATALTSGPSFDAGASPDGRTFSVSLGKVHGDQAALGLVPAGDPSHVRSIETNGAHYRWRDSNTISFTRDEHGTANLWLQPLAGGPPRKLTSFSDGAIADYAWSRDGRRAVVAHVVDSVDVVLLRR